MFLSFFYRKKETEEGMEGEREGWKEGEKQRVREGGQEGGMLGKRNEERRVESRPTFPSLRVNKVQSLDFNPGFPTVILITSLFRMSKTKLLAIPPMCNFLMPLGRNGSEFCRAESLYSFGNPI